MPARNHHTRVPIKLELKTFKEHNKLFVVFYEERNDRRFLGGKRKRGFYDLVSEQLYTKQRLNGSRRAVYLGREINATSKVGDKVDRAVKTGQRLLSHISLGDTPPIDARPTQL